MREIRQAPDVAEFIIGPAEGRTRWLIRARLPHIRQLQFVT
jgi:hypothetical protein